VDLTVRAAESMLLMTVLFAAAIVLRSTKVLAEEHAGVFAKAITQLILPALVFGHLALTFSSGVLLMGLGCLAGRWVFRLPHPSLGALVLCTASPRPRPSASRWWRSSIRTITAWRRQC
jgi:hypothetical protein